MQPVHLFGVAPLQKRLVRLVVLEVFLQRTIDDHLVVLDLAADHSVGLIEQVLVDLDLGEAWRRPRRVPFFAHVIVHHDIGLGAHYRLLAICLTHFGQLQNNIGFYLEKNAQINLVSYFFVVVGNSSCELMEIESKN
ncbi:hypothetical protein BpHYR1_015270 [Brachionus plicatilis]|uniref:Uncharacterized protein n=1 Tax=Brachionus plicatilis TaxID=10195 RepID=A0A3M7P4I6_BRAPC|nr:hypothetical protein BpHYR1_015270 [Brachionus plicatilis]